MGLSYSDSSSPLRFSLTTNSSAALAARSRRRSSSRRIRTRSRSAMPGAASSACLCGATRFIQFDSVLFSRPIRFKVGGNL
eukprot:4323123-Pyramimonas_sp.AAC.1